MDTPFKCSCLPWASFIAASLSHGLGKSVFLAAWLQGPRWQFFECRKIFPAIFLIASNKAHAIHLRMGTPLFPHGIELLGTFTHHSDDGMCFNFFGACRVTQCINRLWCIIFQWWDAGNLRKERNHVMQDEWKPKYRRKRRTSEQSERVETERKWWWWRHEGRRAAESNKKEEEKEDEQIGPDEKYMWCIWGIKKEEFSLKGERKLK